jgi:hypothetical protein
MHIVTILNRKFEGSVWTLDGDDYSGLTWLSDSAKPTEAELQALWPTVETEIAFEAVEQERLSAYRETADPIFFQYQRGDATEAEWLAAVDAVKTAHPYPKA